jgi:hypothetical protein
MKDLDAWNVNVKDKAVQVAQGMLFFIIYSTWSGSFNDAPFSL